MRSGNRRAFLASGLAAAGLARRAPAIGPPEGRVPRALAPTEAQVTAVALSPDGSRVAVGGDDGRIRLLDFATGGEVAALAGGAGPIRALAFDAAGRRIVAGADGPAVEVEPGIGRRFESEGGVVLVWDPTGPRPAARIACEAPPDAVAFGPGPGPGRVAAVDERFTLRSWRADGGDESAPLRPREAAEMAGHDAEVRTAFAADGGRAASVAPVRYDDEAQPAPEDRLVLWDAAARRVRSVSTGGRGDAIRALALTPDGRAVACASKDGRLTLRDFATGAIRSEARADGLGRPGLVAVAVPRAGAAPLLLAAADGRVALWRPGAPAAPQIVAVSAGTPRAVMLAAGAIRGVSGGFDPVPAPGRHGLPPHAPLVLWEVAAPPLP